MVSSLEREYLVKLQDHEGVDDNGHSKKINSQPCHLGSFILSHSKRLMNDVILAIDGFKNNKFYSSDTDSTYIQKNDYNILKTNDLAGKEFFQSEHDYGDAGIVYGLFLCPKVKFCIVINEMGILSEETTFKCYDQEISGVSFKDLLDLERGQTIHDKSKLTWKRELQGIKVPHRGIDCENCLEDETCQSCITDPKMNCFDCEIAKPCKYCYKKITQIETNSTEINKLKRQ